MMNSIIDLTHTITPSMPTWDGTHNFSLRIITDYADATGPTAFRVQEFTCKAGTGTHLDAPAHCNPQGATIDRMPLEILIRPGVMIDVSAVAHERYQLLSADVATFEERTEQIKPGSIVIINTGWGSHWHNPQKYMGLDSSGNRKFPTIHPEAAEFLAARSIAGLAIDTLGPDTPAQGYPIHRLLLQRGIYLIENVANAHELPTHHFTVIVAPLKIEGATESPIRLFAFW